MHNLGSTMNGSIFPYSTFHICDYVDDWIIIAEVLFTEENHFLIDYINTSPPDRVTVRMEGLLLTSEQLQPLINRFLPDGEARYVSDEIINTYITHLEHKYLEEEQPRRRVYMMKTFITCKISIGCVNEISMRQIEKGFISRITNQIAQNEQIFIPINRNKNHRYLAVVHVKQRQIQLLDSSPNTSIQDTELTLVLKGMERISKYLDTMKDLTKPFGQILICRFGLCTVCRAYPGRKICLHVVCS